MHITSRITNKKILMYSFLPGKVYSLKARRLIGFKSNVIYLVLVVDHRINAVAEGQRETEHT